jgi:hypothetical protein
MKSITIHGIDEPLWAMLKSKSQADGVSLNRVIKALLEVSLGITPKVDQERKLEFQSFCGVWSDTDLQEFETARAACEKIDEADWQ